MLAALWAYKKKDPSLTLIIRKLRILQTQNIALHYTHNCFKKQLLFTDRNVNDSGRKAAEQFSEN